jgi:Big-like domain-containing protein/invasin-like protein/calcineurin-like phosphoesterase family protein
MRPVQHRLFRQTVAVTLALGFAACSDTNDPMRPGVQALFTTPTGLLTANPPQIFVGAGDISSCSNSGDEATAKLLDAIPDPATVYNIGDDAYDNGTTSEFNNCYGPTWGRHKYRTKPTPGNHEYNSSGAAPYYAYFGAAAGPSGRGYYSYDLGAWHILSLNSNVSSSSGSAQDVWLRADLAAHPNVCTLAYYHHPLYSSTGGTGSGGTTYSSSRGLVNDLYAAHADLILNGHRHFYERLAPMDPSGKSDPVNGVREIIAGTGGIGGGSETNLFPLHQTGDGSTFGVLKLYLYDDSYAWKFIPVAGKTYTDSGSTACHSSGGGGAGGVSASNSTVTVSPASITAGSATSTITVTAKDGNGNPVAGATVVLSATGTGNTITQPASTTNSSGVATGTISSTVAEVKTMSATANGIALNQKPTVTVTSSAASALVFTGQPQSTAAGATITPAVTVEVRDQFNNKVTSPAASVTAAIGTNPSAGTLSGTSTVTSSNGVASFSTLSIDKAGKGYTLTASATGLTSATSSPFDVTAVVPTVSATNSLVAASSPITAGAGSSTITVTVKDGSGNPMSGITVTLSATGNGNTIAQPADTTNASGIATGSLSSTGAGTKTITAVAGGTTLSQKPVVTVNAGPADAGTSTVAASPSSITAGSGSSTITVTVKDAFGNPVSSSAVVLAASGTGNSFIQPGATNASGVTTGSISSTDVQSETVSATADGLAITQTAPLTVTATPPPAVISQTLLTSGNNTTNQTTYTTASITPAPNTLITIAVLSQQSTAVAADPTVTGGGIASWDVVNSVVFDTKATPHQRVTVYRAMSPAPGSGPITIKFSVNVSHAEWIVSQWSGVATTGTNGAGAIVQSASAAADAASGLTVSLAPFSSSNNVAYGLFGVVKSTVAVTPGSGFTEIDEQPSAEGSTSASDLEAEWAVNINNVSATWATLNGGALAIELKAGP